MAVRLFYPGSFSLSVTSNLFTSCSFRLNLGASEYPSGVALPSILILFCFNWRMASLLRIQECVGRVVQLIELRLPYHVSGVGDGALVIAGKEAGPRQQRFRKPSVDAYTFGFARGIICLEQGNGPLQICDDLFVYFRNGASCEPGRLIEVGSQRHGQVAKEIDQVEISEGPDGKRFTCQLFTCTVCKVFGFRSSDAFDNGIGIEDGFIGGGPEINAGSRPENGQFVGIEEQVGLIVQGSAQFIGGKSTKDGAKACGKILFPVNVIRSGVKPLIILE